MNFCDTPVDKHCFKGYPIGFSFLKYRTLKRRTLSVAIFFIERIANHIIDHISFCNIDILMGLKYKIILQLFLFTFIFPLFNWQDLDRERANITEIKKR